MMGERLAGSGQLAAPAAGRTTVRRSAMCCEHLICARCAGRVAEGRCPTCRSARDALHHRGTDWSAYAIPLLVTLAVVLYVILALHLRA